MDRLAGISTVEICPARGVGEYLLVSDGYATSCTTERVFTRDIWRHLSRDILLLGMLCGAIAANTDGPPRHIPDPA